MKVYRKTIKKYIFHFRRITDNTHQHRSLPIESNRIESSRAIKDLLSKIKWRRPQTNKAMNTPRYAWKSVIVNQAPVGQATGSLIYSRLAGGAHHTWHTPCTHV